MDTLLGFYRLILRSEKWYQRIFFHFCDVSLVNAWLLYRRDLDLSESTDKPLSLYDFKGNVSFCLRNQNRQLARYVGRPSTSQACVKPTLRGPKRKLPPKTVNEDQIGHVPLGLTKTGRCKNRGCTGVSMYFCMKCKVYLCIGYGKDCFALFHRVDFDMSDFPN